MHQYFDNHFRTTLELSPGIRVEGPEDAQWVHDMAELATEESQGAKYYGYIECIPEGRDPWKSYFGDSARKLKGIKAKYDPAGLINGLHCKLLDSPAAARRCTATYNILDIPPNNVSNVSLC